MDGTGVSNTEQRVPRRIRRIQTISLVMLVVCGTINYLDRGALSVANPAIRADLGVSLSEMGLLLSAFAWSYALVQLPVGGLSPNDPEVAPLRSQKVPLLPPTLVATAEYDVLRDEGIAYAEKLETAGVAVAHLHAPDMHHNFPVHPATVARFPQCDFTLAEVAGWLRSVAR
jgi:acetyl esterase/lipase